MTTCSSKPRNSQTPRCAATPQAIEPSMTGRTAQANAVGRPHSSLRQRPRCPAGERQSQAWTNLAGSSPTTAIRIKRERDPEQGGRAQLTTAKQRVLPWVAAGLRPLARTKMSANLTIRLCEERSDEAIQ